MRIGEATEVLAALRCEFAFTQLFSPEETDPTWSYERDKAVARWCHAHGVGWTEWPQTGVVRGLKDRRGWARWHKRMDAPCVPAPAGFRAAAGFAPSSVPSDLPTLQDLAVPHPPDMPPAGEAAAQAMLAGFLGGRALGYRRHLSSPLTAHTGCSRLSEHLASGLPPSGKLPRRARPADTPSADDPQANLF